MNASTGKLFEPPRPGAWEIDLTHFPRPATRYGSALFLESFTPGFAEGTRLYGLLLQGLDFIDVNGFIYATRRSVGAPENSKGPPPKAIFKILARLHPEIRRRLRRSREVVETRAWLEDLRHWDEVVKPTAIREHLAVQQVDIAGLDDSGLARHITAATENAKTAIFRHGRFSLTAYLPVGDYLAHAMRWTGEPIHVLLRPVKGHSEISTNVAAPELAALAEALRSDRTALRGLDEKSPADVIQQLREADGPVGAAARKWIDAVGYRIVTGYDLSDLTALELPDILLAGLRAALSPQATVNQKSAADREAERLRSRIPAEHQGEFDQLLADARKIYRLRDERDHYNDGWAIGLLRHALLEAGRRLAEAGRITEPDYILDATPTEVQDMILGAGGPTDAELGERTRWRRTANAADVPQRLGFAKPPPLPKEWLPPHQARLVRALEVFLLGIYAPEQDASTAHAIRGIPVSPGTYEGTARVVLKADQFGLVQPGDILVARSTSPYFNVLLPLLGGIVTDHGGALSHAAIVSREYGIPGVVGTKTATKTVKDGDWIRVDGDTGEVTVLASKPPVQSEAA